MTDPMIEFAQSYRRFFEACEKIPAWWPRAFQVRRAATVARQGSPMLPRRESIMAAMQAALGLSPEEAAVAWDRWLVGHGQFGLSTFRYGSLSPRFVARQVVIHEPELWWALMRQGGLAMSYHTHQQNTLACMAGLCGAQLNAVVAPPNASALMYEYLGAYIDRINRDSEKLFNGGHFLYNDNPRRVVKETLRALKHGHVVSALCDVHLPGPGAQAFPFFGRAVSSPVGSVELALRQEVPLYAVMLHFEGGRYHLRMRALESRGATLHEVMGQYFVFLEALCRETPHAWQGWEWFGGLPAWS